MRLKRVIVAAVLSLGLVSAVAAQTPSPLSVASVRHYGEGVDHVFEFEIANASDRDIMARGRLVVINVYDASLPSTIAIKDFVVPANGTSKVAVRWGDAPLLGQLRTLLVLNDGQRASLVESSVFWILPIFQAALFVGVAAAVIAVAIVALRLPKYLKARVPPNMAAYVVEFDDTVVTLANRFDVTWQDIVRANRLMPPYELMPGKRIFIPKHGLRRPETAPDA